VGLVKRTLRLGHRWECCKQPAMASTEGIQRF
jgi:hypothetical protein